MTSCVSSVVLHRGFIRTYEAMYRIVTRELIPKESTYCKTGGQIENWIRPSVSTRNQYLAVNDTPIHQRYIQKFISIPHIFEFDASSSDRPYGLITRSGTLRKQKSKTSPVSLIITKCPNFIENGAERARYLRQIYGRIGRTTFALMTPFVTVVSRN